LVVQHLHVSRWFGASMSDSAQVRTLCSAMGEALEVHEYQRFTPLRVQQQGLQGRYRNVRPGDCVVAFSRKDIFTIKQASPSRALSVASAFSKLFIYAFSSYPEWGGVQMTRWWNGRRGFQLA